MKAFSDFIMLSSLSTCFLFINNDINTASYHIAKTCCTLLIHLLTWKTFFVAKQRKGDWKTTTLWHMAIFDYMCHCIHSKYNNTAIHSNICMIYYVNAIGIKFSSFIYWPVTNSPVIHTDLFQHVLEKRKNEKFNS